MFKADRVCEGKMDNYFDTDKANFDPNASMSVGAGMPMGECCNNSYPGVVCPPVYECPQERVCHRYICHEVPHIMPCNTRIVNHHVYRHTYSPCYSCSEQNEVSNVYEPRCCM